MRRFNIDIPVKVRTDPTGPLQASRTANISRGGAFLIMSPPVPNGTRVLIEAEIGGRMVLEGVVVHGSDQWYRDKRPPGFGVQLTRVEARWTDLCSALEATENEGLDGPSNSRVH